MAKAPLYSCGSHYAPRHPAEGMKDAEIWPVIHLLVHLPVGAALSGGRGAPFPDINKDMEGLAEASE